MQYDTSDKLLLFSLGEAFCISAPLIWHSLSCQCESAEFLSTFKHTLKTELFDVAYSKREHFA